MRQAAIWIFVCITLSMTAPIDAADTAAQTQAMQPTARKLAPVSATGAGPQMGKTTSPGKVAPMVAPLSVKQLNVPPAVCTVIPLAWKSVQQKLAEANKAFQKTGNGELQIPYGHLGSYAQVFVPKCCAAGRSFSVAEQQAAGCTRNDQVGACMDKLVKKCLDHPDVKEKAREGIAEHAELSIKTKELSQQLQNFLNKMP